MLRTRFGSAFTVLVALFGSPAVAAEGEITILGVGTASHAPEFVQIQIDVTSLCYDSSVAAKDANAALANNVLTAMQSFAPGADDQVTATGGVNIIRTETVYVGNQPTVLCEMKWRATNTLRLQTSLIDQIPDIQDQILGLIDATVADPTQVSQTYAEFAQPSFHIRPATLTALKQQAHGLALDDAQLQFDVFNGRCHFSNAHLSRILPPEDTVTPYRDGQPMAADASSTPIIPDEMTVQSNWKFVWTFDPDSSSCPQ